MLREEMEGRGRKKKITLEVTMRIANGTVVGQGEQTAVVNAGDTVMVQFAFRPEEAAQEEETTRDEQVEMVEQDAADEEVLQLGALEYPESATWRPNRLRKSWFLLWKARNIKDDQVEKGWKVSWSSRRS